MLPHRSTKSAAFIFRQGHIHGCAGTRNNEGPVRALWQAPLTSPCHHEYIFLWLPYAYAISWLRIKPPLRIAPCASIPEPQCPLHQCITSGLPTRLYGLGGSKVGAGGYPTHAHGVIGNEFASRPWPTPRVARYTARDTDRELSHRVAKSSIAQQVPRWSNHGHLIILQNRSD
jgi:hypothetical protein